MDICISGWAMRHRLPVAIEDIYSDRRIPHDTYRPTFVKSLAMVPIRTLDPVGAIGNYWASSHRPTPEELELLQALADTTAVAIENVHVYEELESARVETLRRLALAAEYRDDTTHEHTGRVARTASLMAERLGLPAHDVALIREAAPLHDIGKLSVPDAVLLKPGDLNADEFEVMKEHTTSGAAILAGSRSEVLRLGEEIALTHHEWWDGNGYPRRLREDDIPASGQIVAVADVFDALTHDRPYKQAWPLEAAVAEIRRLGGTQFSPRVVEAFETLDHAKLVSIAPFGG